MQARPRLLVIWLVLAMACCVTMWTFPGQETIPYHVGWIGLALAYGLEPWRASHTLLAITGYAIASGVILLTRAAMGVIAWEETTEIPLMCTLALLMAWHVRRRQLALAALTELSDLERERAQHRERVRRVTTHEMRTPITIASGFVDLLLARSDDAGQRADLEVVRDELGRLTRASERLLRMIGLQDRLDRQPHDIDAMMRRTAARWSAVSAREWRVSSSGGVYPCSSERLRAGLDTLLENAVRYTREGEVVRLVSFRQSGFVFVGVADAGPGLDWHLAQAINRGDFLRPGAQPNHWTQDPRSQTGLGLGLVHEVVRARGGRVVAGRASEGGTLLLMALPENLPFAPVRETVPRSRMEGAERSQLTLASD